MVALSKILGVVAIVCITVLGFLYAFGIVSSATVLENGSKIVSGVGVLLVSSVLLRLLGGSNVSKDPEPPPTL